MSLVKIHFKSLYIVSIVGHVARVVFRTPYRATAAQCSLQRLIGHLNELLWGTPLKGHGFLPRSPYLTASHTAVIVGRYNLQLWRLIWRASIYSKYDTNTYRSGCPCGLWERGCGRGIGTLSSSRISGIFNLAWIAIYVSIT